jgi:hypothetical protein
MHLSSLYLNRCTRDKLSVPVHKVYICKRVYLVYATPAAERHAAGCDEDLTLRQSRLHRHHWDLHRAPSPSTVRAVSWFVGNQQGLSKTHQTAQGKRMALGCPQFTM